MTLEEEEEEDEEKGDEGKKEERHEKTKKEKRRWDGGKSSEGKYLSCSLFSFLSMSAFYPLLPVSFLLQWSWLHAAATGNPVNAFPVPLQQRSMKKQIEYQSCSRHARDFRGKVSTVDSTLTAPSRAGRRECVRWRGVRRKRKGSDEWMNEWMNEEERRGLTLFFPSFFSFSFFLAFLTVSSEWKTLQWHPISRFYQQ